MFIKTNRCYFVLILLLIGFLGNLEAQYLKVKNKNGKIRNIAEINGSVLEEVKKGDILIILQETSTSNNNYYQVRCNLGDCKGWIIRTDVKRIKEEIPDEILQEYKFATSLFGIGQIPPAFYSSAHHLKGKSLKTKLHQLTKNHKVFSYKEVYSILPKTDQDPFDTSNVILLYSARTVNKNHRDRGGRYEYKKHGYTYQDSWNREHVWPKSFGFPNPKDTAYTDLHHIRPADKSMNTRRNNRSFDYATEPYLDNGGTVETDCFISDNWTWEPPDNVKGDVARMVFYMAVRYEGYEKDGILIMDLELIDSIPAKSSKEPIVGKLSTLLEWHIQDPVDNWERRRNDIIYRFYQGNRNPFIDHPEFVSRIWQN